VADAEQSYDCEGRTSIRVWGEHLRGAAKLIEFRGPEQFRTKNAFSLLRHFRCLLVRSPFVSCSELLIINIPAHSLCSNQIRNSISTSQVVSMGRVISSNEPRP
jgi:hypothetical protein